MKSITIVLLCMVYAVSAHLECADKELSMPKEWKDMAKTCIQEMRNQVGAELNASMTYMAMGAYFSKDTVNRPGFAELFFNSASEEREHAIKLIRYLLMRGELTTRVSDLIQRHIKPTQTSWKNGEDALESALILEAQVTRKIRHVIKVCEDGSNFNDYHLVDYLTGDFLEEQYHGQRDIAGKLSTLQKLMKNHGALGEWLFDKKLLEGAQS